MAIDKLNFSTGAIVNPYEGLTRTLGSFADAAREKLARDELRQDRLAQQEESKRQWDIQNTRAEAQAKRQEDEYQRGVAKDTATSEALSAVLDPKRFQDTKMTGEKNAIVQSLANLSPQDRVIAEQELKAYSPEASKSGWLSSALTGSNVDQSKVLGTQSSLLSMKLNDPNSAEFRAKQAAERAEKAWEIGQREAAAVRAESRADAKEANKVKSMFDVLSVRNTTPTQTVTNEAVIKNIADKQSKFGDAYVDRYGQNAAGIKNIEDTIAKVQADTRIAPATKELQIKSLTDSLNAQLKGVEHYALGKSGMGKDLKEIPDKVYGTADTKISKEDYVAAIRKELGSKPSAEAVALATQEIKARYPDADKSVAGYNAIASALGGTPITTGDAKVAEFNAKMAGELAKAGKGKSKESYNSIDKTVKALDSLYNEYDDPDLLVGQGAADTIKTQMASIQAKYGVSDDLLASQIAKAGPVYNDAFMGVNEEGLERQTENLVRAIKGLPPLGANDKLAREK